MKEYHSAAIIAANITHIVLLINSGMFLETSSLSDSIKTMMQSSRATFG